MLSDEKNNPTNAQYTEAIRNINCLLGPEECPITIKSILSVTRMALEGKPTKEECHGIQWLLRVGEYLADVETYRPVPV